VAAPSAGIQYNALPDDPNMGIQDISESESSDIPGYSALPIHAAGGVPPM